MRARGLRVPAPAVTLFCRLARDIDGCAEGGRGADGRAVDLVLRVLACPARPPVVQRAADLEMQLQDGARDDAMRAVTRTIHRLQAVAGDAFHTN